jgi:signal transduction histidine kinase
MQALQKILIVDDKVENLYALERILNQTDVEVIQAAGGNDALIASLNHDFALSILDVQMPGMDGYELAELLRSQERTRNLPIIFLTAVYRDEDHVHRGYKAGAVDFMTKPFDPGILLCKVNVFLELDRQRTTVSKMRDELLRINEALEEKVQLRTRSLEQQTRQLRFLTQQLSEIEERERRRIAQILHNDLQQILAAARLQLQSACESLPSVPMLKKVEQLLEESMAKSRRLSHELSPPVLQQSGLVVALEWMIKQMKKQFDLQVELHTHGEHLLNNETLKIFLFRSAQELLFNVVKHSGVKYADVILSNFEDCLSLTVSDNGQGINSDIKDPNYSTTGLGLLTIRERAHHLGGSLSMESTPGRGSRFILTVPLNLKKMGVRHTLAFQRQLSHSMK